MNNAFKNLNKLSGVFESIWFDELKILEMQWDKHEFKVKIPWYRLFQRMKYGKERTKTIEIPKFFTRVAEPGLSVSQEVKEDNAVPGG
jgi:hypothetical protein